MIMFDKKKAYQTIMAKRSPDGSVTSSPMESQKVMDEDGEPDGRHAAAEDILSAMSEKNPMKLMEALSNFHDLHQAMSDKPDPQE